jgi:hypothetical protein
MKTQITRAKYVAPKLEVQRLRDLPSALASSGGHCHITGSKTGWSCSTSHHGGK